MTDREARLRRWVQQPPAAPNVQYLRDAERKAAIEELGKRSSVLDIGSESTLTESLEAESITRVDFSEDSSKHAREILGPTVDRYEIADLDSPDLPFSDDTFDSAVSIGPFDWKFLDVETLVDELHRVIDADGMLVFSVPTPRSPYSSGPWNRYYTPEEAFQLISPDWSLDSHEQLFQYPGLVNWAINRLPDAAQEPFVDIEWKLSNLLTDHDLWSRASYLVLGVRPLKYEHYLDEAVACLFRTTDENGFWDTDDGTFVRAFEYALDDGKIFWTLDDSNQWRYAPFALMGVLKWRTSELGTDQFDDQISKALAYFNDRLSDTEQRDSMPSYAHGPLITAFTLAADIFDNQSYILTAFNLYQYTSDEYDFTHAEDSLLAYGWSHLYEQTGNEEIREDLSDALWAMNEKLTGNDFFQFENPTTRRHQNQMYTLWGLCRTIKSIEKPGFLSTIERVIDRTIDRRMREDGAFIWEDVSRRALVRSDIGRRLRNGTARPPHWEFLYECHQTFFVNAIEEYYAAGGENNYDIAVREAMGWIYGNNKLGVDLVERSGLGVPMRFMTTDGRIDIDDQMYKGSYEIGSYIMALTGLLTGEISNANI